MAFRAMLVLPGLAWTGGLLAALVRPPYWMSPVIGAAPYLAGR